MTVATLSVQKLVAGCRGRVDLAARLPVNGIGVELGVAQGGFSARILEVSSLAFLYSIDQWADKHDSAEYRSAVARLDPYRTRNAIWRMRFDEARPLIPDHSLDFLYIDGYAHTGEEDGATIRQWWSAVKPGGVMAGDDYDPETWPRVVHAVDRFVRHAGTSLAVIPRSAEPDDPVYGNYPTWVVIHD